MRGVAIIISLHKNRISVGKIAECISSQSIQDWTKCLRSR